MSRMLRALQTLEKGVSTGQEPVSESKPSDVVAPPTTSEQKPSPPNVPVPEVASSVNAESITFDTTRPEDARSTLFAMELNWDWVTAQLAAVSDAALPVAEPIEPTAETWANDAPVDEQQTGEPSRAHSSAAARRLRRVRRSRTMPGNARDVSDTFERGASADAHLWRTPALEPLADVNLLAASLRSQVAGHPKPRWIMVVAASEATTYSGSLLPLAGAIAAQQENVLVIDARPPKSFGGWEPGTTPLGLGDLLAGRATWPEVIEPTDQPRVFVVGAGQRPKEEKLPPARLAIFNMLPPRFDYILVRGATPADRLTRVLAARAGANYLLVGLDLDRADRIRHAMAELGAEGICLVGAIALKH